MATLIYLTEHFAYANSDPASQPLYKAMDVSRWDVLDLIVIAALDGAGTVSFRIHTGMQRQSTMGWVEVDRFASVTNSAPVQRLTLTSARGKGFMRYIRCGERGVGRSRAVHDLRHRANLRGAMTHGRRPLDHRPVHQGHRQHAAERRLRDRRPRVTSTTDPDRG
jgi:hypothetical protein